MEVVYITIGVSVIIAVLFFIAFIKSVKSGQYEDTYTPSVRMLFDDELVKEKEDKKIKNKSTNNNNNNK
ncbi:MAG: cbb3-type cytochrome oxidase assembly protein CcoS [Flavobacteriaceae bacterium]|nr:MAG: cbb3-type cytochrome oxidase assembly protein CcoS [Flavobacteriaceae bacterium]